MAILVTFLLSMLLLGVSASFVLDFVQLPVKTILVTAALN